MHCKLLILFFLIKVTRYYDGTSRSSHCAGLFYGGSGYQLGCNICIILTIISWCGTLSYIFHFIFDFILGLDLFERSRKTRETIGYAGYDGDGDGRSEGNEKA